MVYHPRVQRANTKTITKLSKLVIKVLLWKVASDSKENKPFNEKLDNDRLKGSSEKTKVENERFKAESEAKSKGDLDKSKIETTSRLDPEVIKKKSDTARTKSEQNRTNQSVDNVRH